MSPCPEACNSRVPLSLVEVLGSVFRAYLIPLCWTPSCGAAFWAREPGTWKWNAMGWRACRQWWLVLSKFPLEETKMGNAGRSGGEHTIILGAWVLALRNYVNGFVHCAEFIATSFESALFMSTTGRVSVLLVTWIIQVLKSSRSSRIP